MRRCDGMCEGRVRGRDLVDNKKAYEQKHGREMKYKRAGYLHDTPFIKFNHPCDTFPGIPSSIVVPETSRRRYQINFLWETIVFCHH